MRSDKLRWDVWEYMQSNVIKVPPLKDRIEDLPLLLLSSARRAASLYGKTIDKIDSTATLSLTAYSFPGNMRELDALVEAAVLRAKGNILTLENFSLPK